MIVYALIQDVLEDPVLAKKVQSFYDQGHRIILACSSEYRNSFQLENLFDQLNHQKIHYHQLSFCKPPFDLYLSSQSLSK